MKVFMVGCANERGEMVTMNTFLTKNDAQKHMEKEFDKECFDAEERGYDIESKECCENYAELIIDEDDQFYRWNIYKEDIHATPSAILEALCRSMWDDIDRVAQAPVPGYSSCRPAVIDLRGEQFKKLSFGNGEELVSVEAYVPMAGLAIIVKCVDGETRPGLVGPEAFDTDEILELHSIITNIKHPVCAFNPFWLMNDDWHDTLTDILDQTEEEYQKMIQNNPKNKK